MHIKARYNYWIWIVLFGVILINEVLVIILKLNCDYDLNDSSLLRDKQIIKIISMGVFWYVYIYTYILGNYLNIYELISYI